MLMYTSFTYYTKWMISLSDTKWDWDIVCGYTTDFVCNILQVNERTDSSKEEWKNRDECVRIGNWY